MNHVIRLRGPWQFEVVDTHHGAQPVKTAGRQSMPADWTATLGPGFLGTVVYRRVFHKPTGLEPGQGVWLLFERADSLGIVRLNQNAIGQVDTTGGRFLVDKLLLAENHLEVAVTHHTAGIAGGLTGLVSLEIQTVRPRPSE